MKKLTLLTIGILIGLNVYPQNKLNIVTTFGKTDTTYSFNIYGKDLNKELKNLYLSLGIPITENEGMIIWTRIEISGIGNDLLVTLEDCIVTIKNHKITYKYFSFKHKDKNNRKEQKLKCLKDNQYREFQIYIYNKQHKNIVDNDKYKEILLKYFEQIIK